LREQIAQASEEERRWLARAAFPSLTVEVVGADDTAEPLSPERIKKLVAAFFRLLQAASLTRSNLTPELADLCSPFGEGEGEEEDDDGGAGEHSAGAPRFVPFVSRLLARVLDPDALLDDLDVVPFEEGEEEGEHAGGQAAHANKVAGAADTFSSSGTHKDSGSAHASSSLSLDPSSAATSATSPPSSTSSNWGSSFFGSLASVVTSVAASAVSVAGEAAKGSSLRSLGFGSARRPMVAPGEERPVIVFVAGGIGHDEARRVREAGERWTKRVEQHRARQRGTKRSNNTTPPPTVLVGSTHVATARELLQQLLRAAGRGVESA